MITFKSFLKGSNFDTRLDQFKSTTTTEKQFNNSSFNYKIIKL